MNCKYSSPLGPLTALQGSVTEGFGGNFVKGFIVTVGFDTELRFLPGIRT